VKDRDKNSRITGVILITISNFLTGSSETELLRPQRVRMLTRLSIAKCEAIIVSMPLCDEWGPTAILAAPKVAIRGADEDLTVA
jgi:hypothetical protein